MTVTELIYRAAGEFVVGSSHGDCRLCGARNVRGTEFERWVKKTFTNWSDLHPGEIIAAAIGVRLVTKPVI